MAKKKVAQEPCMFCSPEPCTCEVVSKSKLDRQSGGDDGEDTSQEERSDT